MRRQPPSRTVTERLQAWGDGVASSPNASPASANPSAAHSRRRANRPGLGSPARRLHGRRFGAGLDGSGRPPTRTARNPDVWRMSACRWPLPRCGRSAASSPSAIRTLGHEVPGMRGVYGHAHPGHARRPRHHAARAVGSLSARTGPAGPRSIVPVLNALPTAQREPQTKIGSQNRTCLLPESGNSDSARSRVAAFHPVELRLSGRGGRI
jgi:hypothetical protein